MRAVLTHIAGDLRRRRVQTVVVFIIVMLAAGVGTLALEILSASSAPFDRAFAQNAGAHLDVQFDGRKVTPAQLGATQQLPDVTASAGPWPVAIIPFEAGTQKVSLYVIGRSDPGGAVDRLQLVAGGWPQQPGEIVLTRSQAQQIHVTLGDHLIALSRPDKPQLTVVGEALDIDEADASLQTPQFSWVVPEEVANLVPIGGHGDYQMLFRFRQAASNGDLQRETQEIGSVLPPGAIVSSLPYLLIKSIVNVTSTLILTFLLAFSAFALAAAAFIVANVVAGAVLASFRDIGVAKALGFTPGLVVLSFVGQMLVPALAGCAIGATLGVLGSEPILSASAAALGAPATDLVTIAPALIATLGALVVVALAAALPALRGGLLRPVVALAQGVAPSARHRSILGGAVERLRLPRTISLGAGDAFARPVRGLLTALAVLVAVATLTFAFGIHTSLARIADAQAFNPDETITRYGSYPDAQVMQTLHAQPETSTVVAFAYVNVGISGVSSPVSAIPMRGDARALGFQLIQGRWFAGPGEAVGGGAFVRAAHLSLGETFTVTRNGHTIPLRLVGIYFDTDNLGNVMRFDWSNYLAVDPTAQPDQYFVLLRPGADPHAYARRVEASAPDFLSVMPRTAGSPILGTIDTVLAVLVIVLALIAVAGVFNTMLLSTRERIRDTATLKTLGMTPGQAVGMVVSSAAVLGIAGAALGIPAGVWLHQEILALMATVVNDPFPSPALTRGVFGVGVVLLLALAGIVAAVLGAALPARWAARQRVAEVLRAE